MPKFIVERPLPPETAKSPDVLKHLARKVVDEVANGQGKYTWLRTYVCADTFYSIFVAKDKDALDELAERLGMGSPCPGKKSFSS